MVEKILNNTTPYGKIRASHEGWLHSSTLRRSFESVIFTDDVRFVGSKPSHVTFLLSNWHLFVLLNFNC